MHVYVIDPDIKTRISPWNPLSLDIVAQYPEIHSHGQIVTSPQYDAVLLK